MICLSVMIMVLVVDTISPQLLWERLCSHYLRHSRSCRPATFQDLPSAAAPPLQPVRLTFYPLLHISSSSVNSNSNNSIRTTTLSPRATADTNAQVTLRRKSPRALLCPTLIHVSKTALNCAISQSLLLRYVQMIVFVNYC